MSRHDTLQVADLAATPAAPASGSLLYVKNGQVYRRNAGGAETLVEGGAGGVPATRAINSGTGLTGGGDLSADRTLAVVYGSAAGTSAQGNDARLSDTRTPTDSSVTFAKFASAAIAASGASSATQIVRADDSRLSDARPPSITHHAQRFLTSGPSIPNNTGTVLLWNIADSLDGFTYNATTGAFTVPAKGRYHLAAAVTWPANAAGYRSIRFLVNGASLNLHNDDSQTSLTSSHESYPTKLAAGDLVTVAVLQNSGSALTLNTTQAANWVVLSYLGPSA